ncbi:MAG: hypothetical protein IBX44_05825 [Sulfurospirillum sp.]|nr:hypothetical protein [Sulfurospirillum sp.]
MRALILILIFLSSVFAANLLTYNIYERTDRVDLMLSFDAPYEGRILQKKGENITILTLEDLSFDKLVEKNINSSIAQAISISPNAQSTIITIKSDKNIGVIASKTVDGFGLRVRSKPIETQAINTNENQLLENNVGKNRENILDTDYILVISVLIVLLLFMLWLKNKLLQQKGQLQAKGSWLFKDTLPKGSKKEVHVLHKKTIDNQNSVVLLEFDGKEYLVMTGSSNLLLEKFSQSTISNEDDFEKAFEENRKKLDDFLRLQDGGIDKYKSKASGDFHPSLEQR